MYIKDDIIRLVKEQDVRFIRLQFTDMNGCLKNIAITENQLKRALNNGVMFDGAAIDGFLTAEDSDLYLHPDLNSFTIFPWRPQQGKVARLICDVYTSDGKPFEGDPRHVLKREIARAEKLGYELNVGQECEFFLFHTDEKGAPTTKTYDEGGYFDLAPLDMGEDCRRDISQTLAEMGFEIESSHHEVAHGQHEVDFKYMDALAAADSMMTFKLVVKNIAYKHGLHASFMAKPVYGIPGSCMHINMSLHRDGLNVLSNDDGTLSDTAKSFAAGILEHAEALTAVLNPTVNSYKRLISGEGAPCYVAWSEKNRSALLRVAAAEGSGKRIELRSPDPTCNPYLAIALVLRAGLDGVEKKLTPPAPIDRQFKNMPPAELKKLGVRRLPESLKEAVTALEADDVLRDVLGEHLFKKFSEYKIQEWRRYSEWVSQWEINEYLTKF